MFYKNDKCLLLSQLKKLIKNPGLRLFLVAWT